MSRVSFAEGTPLSDLVQSNGYRRQFLDALHTALRSRVSSGDVTNLEWHPPGDQGVPEESSRTVSTVWGHMDKLRIMNKYFQLLHAMGKSHPRLTGHESSCCNALEWFRPLCAPMEVPPPETLARLQNMIYLLPCPAGQHVFECHKHMVCSDRDMTRLLLSEHFPDSREYDVDVCAEMLRDKTLDFDRWKSEFGQWRELGLLYPLAVAAKAMPSLGYWLPRSVHKYPLAQEFNAALARIRDEGARGSREVLSDLCKAWESDETHIGTLLGQTLDRLAVLMRVQSLNNTCAPSRNLDAAVAVFQAKHPAQGMHALNRSMWVSLASDILDTFPPSLLCPLLATQHRSSWGIPKLALEATSDGALGFKRFPLAWIDTQGWEFQHDRQVLEETLLCESAPGGPDEAYTCRIKDVLWRLGEVCTSPEVHTCMLHPQRVLDAIASNEPSHKPRLAAAADPRDDEDFIISHMCGDMSHTDTDSTYQRLTHSMENMHPATRVHILREPVHLCMWRLDLPPRALVRMPGGENSSPLHEAPRQLINHKLALPTRASMHVSGSPMCAQDVLTSVRRWALSNWDGLMRSESIAHAGGRLTLTTLQEAVEAFTGTDSPCVNKGVMGKSCSWDHPGIDARYAEHQEGENGFRYRDWVALHCSPECTQQARLAAHCISVSEWHVTQVPWLRSDGSVTWVHTTATLPIVSRTMRGDTLRQAVESRYMHDPQLLTVARDDDVLTRANMELYDTDGRVVIAYAPVAQAGDKPSRLQMMAFHVAQPAKNKKGQVRWCDQAGA